MQIVCDNCSTKYSIADEKVAGRVFRTPCKRCGSTMIIEGTVVVEQDRGLRGQRSETSVLFSLDNLAAAAGTTAAQASASDSSGSQPEGSGLLDIRRMASAYKQESEDAEPDFDGFVAMPSATPVVLASPMTAQRARGKSPLLWLVGGATGMAAIAAIAVSLMIFKTGTGTDAQASPAVPAPVVAVASTPEPVAAPVVKPEPSKPEPAKPEPVTQPIEPKKKPVAKPKTRKPRTAKKPRKPKKPKRVAEKPAKKPKKGCLEEVGCLLASNPPPCCRKYTDPTPNPQPSAKPDPSLKEKPGRRDILDGMKKVRSRMAACSARSPRSGQVKISVKVAGSGKVASVTVKEAPDKALGSCVADAARKAKFPKTQKGAKFTYPYVFR